MVGRCLTRQPICNKCRRKRAAFSDWNAVEPSVNATLAVKRKTTEYFREKARQQWVFTLRWDGGHIRKLSWSRIGCANNPTQTDNAIVSVYVRIRMKPVVGGNLAHIGVSSA